MNYRPTQEPGIFHVSRDSRHSDGIRLTEIDSPQWQGPLTESDNEAWGGQRPASSYEEWVKEDKETEAGS